MTSTAANILVVDDEAVVRRVLGDALAQGGYHVRSAASGEAALSTMADDPADLILLDLQLGDTDGVEVMQVARERWPQTQVIILTAHGSMASAIAAVRHGAADYLLKPIGVDELRQRVAQVITRSRASRDRQERIRAMYHQLQALVADEGLATPQPSALAVGERLSAGPLTIDVSRHIARMDGHAIDLTPTEFAIIHALVRTQGKVVSCRQIVGGFQGAVESEDEARQILRPHIVRLRRKIEADPANPVYIESVRGLGYRWGGRAEAGWDD